MTTLPVNQDGAASDELSQLTDLDLRNHLKSLGLSSLAEYQAWCLKHGFSPRTQKTWHQRCHERFHVQAPQLKQAAVRRKRAVRKPRETLAAMFAGELATQELSPPFAAIAAAFGTLTEPSVQQAFRELVEHVIQSTELLRSDRAVAALAASADNTFLGGMAALARQHQHWLRPISDWRPESRNPWRQFHALAQHLMARYPVPEFLDSAWFRGDSPEVQQQQSWYRQLASGSSPRKMDWPIALSRAMAREFLRAPSDYLIESALRWGQVRGLGGTPRQVALILSTRLANSFENDAYWVDVMRWFLAQSVVEAHYVGPVFDYLQQMRFGDVATRPNDRRRPACRMQSLIWDYNLRERPDPLEAPQDPEFSLRGRTFESLHRLTTAWHQQLSKLQAVPSTVWPATGIPAFDWTERQVNGVLHWTITELRSGRDLLDEGRLMRHCVASYQSHCLTGGSSIWSLRLKRNERGFERHLLTIEVNSSRKSICQIRGRGNRPPREDEMRILRMWASQAALGFGLTATG